jgi:hypothetical protein
MPLSQVMAYNTEHLIDASAHWEALADQREEVFGTVHNEARTLPWEGLGANALLQRTGADYNTALESAENLRAASMIARDGASTLTQLHSRVLYTVEDMQADGFAPTEELGVVDTRASTNPAVAAQRQAQAQAYASQLKSQVADLYTHDAKVGADMSKATADEGKIQFVDHTFKTDGPTTPAPPPQPPMSRKQAADGLKDVNDRIWTHNHVDKPVIDALPPNDPRRTDFHIETEQLNAEKQQYLDVLPQQHPPANVIGPNGVNLPGVPPGVLSDTAAKSGEGWIYPVTPDERGIDPRVASIRVMEPTSQYPNGYLNYLNINGQEVDPFTGRTVPPTNPYAHIPLPKQ